MCPILFVAEFVKEEINHDAKLDENPPERFLEGSSVGQITAKNKDRPNEWIDFL